MASNVETLAQVANTIEDFQSTLTAAEEENKNLTVAKASNIFKSLIPQLKELSNVVGTLSKIVKDVCTNACKNTEEALSQTKINRDSVDDTDQRNMIGSLILNIPDSKLKKDLGVDDERAFEEINEDVLVQALSERYRVDISPKDLRYVKRISKSGSIRIQFDDTKPSSKYRALVNSIKSKGSNKKGESLYANFALTNRRNSLLYTLREAWRNKKIEKYFVDYDGSISVVPLHSSRKIRITSVSTKESNYTLWTMSQSELNYQITHEFADFLKR